jgi:hypothetical protein
MVGRDMVTRLRPVLGVLAAVALLALGLSMGARADAAPSGGEAVVVGEVSARPAAPTRAPRPAVLPLLVLTGLVAVVASSPSRSLTLVGRHRRRPVDDGDDWRSLLLGAPPGLA